MKPNKSINLKDYKPFPFDIPQINLDFVIKDDHVSILSVMQFVPTTKDTIPLILKGDNIILESVFINDTLLENDSYLLNEDELVVENLPNKPFSLSIRSRIDPFHNQSLQGLYLSEGMLTTQCEAEGFRSICFHPDRPDVLSKYRVRIEGDINEYPVMLSNGNRIYCKKVDESSSNHEVLWDDPIPKPCYLFALVAGKLDVNKETYESISGRSIALNIYVDSDDLSYTSHAIRSLVKAMRWDEEVYNLEYDLDEYNIVAVRHFNMGAMENKSLNIFNSKLVLADSNTATDIELERVESVIAHEYFHNWTGNRITCRDWFQLSLKEGLTVFRDQCFTADLHSAAIKRVEDVTVLRNTQFREDSGPTSHAVKPSQYVSIDNFYTTTIYEKGAEVVRMLYTLLGHEIFMNGMRIYVERFDGSAATTEDFVTAITDGALQSGKKIGFDVSQFYLWYYQAGTPEVSIKREWKQDLGILIVKCKQETPSSSNQANKLPLVIPIRLSVIGETGTLDGERLLILDKYEQDFCIKGLSINKKMPILSIMRGFSAPVKLRTDFSIEEYLHLFRYDDDPFSRWDAGQSIMRKALLSRVLGKTMLSLERQLVLAFEYLISTLGEKDPGILATLLSIPGANELEDCLDVIDPIGLYTSMISFKTFLGKELRGPLHQLLINTNTYCVSQWPLGQGHRRIRALAWHWMALSRDCKVLKEAADAVLGDSMTLARAGLNALQPVDCEERDRALNTFYERWKNRPVILDSWFRLEASIPRVGGLDRILELISHPLFDPIAPNAVRAVLGGLTENTKVFHALDGSGYMFLADQLISLDKKNPITASRIVKIFSGWRNFISPHKELMYRALECLHRANLSDNTKEVISLMRE